jgi:serine/threonine protein kinase
MPTSKPDLSDSISQVTNSNKTMHAPGSIIGDRYQIIQKLGREGEGKTYLAKNLQATGDNRCAIEQLSPNYDSEANWQIIKRHLLNEIAVVKRLGDHPQIPQFYDYFIEERQFYLVREYIDGNNLAQEVERKIFNEAETIYLIHDTLRILDFIHKTNVVHRNIQPIHLIRRKRDNTFALINFGAIKEIESIHINLKGELIGDCASSNLSYAAPEQQSGDVNFSSDIYALAKIAVYALTGSTFLEQQNFDWQEQCQISSKLKIILNKMMAFEVTQRYGSALEVLYDLQPLLKIQQVVGGRYLITQYLSGNEGIETYLADNLRRQYQSPCTIEQIKLSDAHSDGKIEIERRFAEELSVLERLGYHEQIPQLWDHFEENDEFYLVQEYIRGENLAQKIAQQNLSTMEIVQILESSLSVLEFVHQNRIIHRNIKPENLVIRHQDQQVILTNFGILADIQTLPNTTSSSCQQDRQNYWSPEQIAGRPTVSSDLYALGMTIIEALTKVKPKTLIRNEITGKLLWTQDFDLDRRLLKIIDKMIELDLGNRYQSAQKVLDDLQKINIVHFNKHSVDNFGIASSNTTFKFSTLTTLIGLLGIICLLGSIEFAFPTVRPAYYWYRGTKDLPSEPQNALNAFTKAIDLKPQSSLAWSGRGDALFAQQLYSQALEAYMRATQLAPDNPQNWKRQGNILYRLEKFTEAIAAYNRALELKRDDAELYNLKGRSLSQLQQYDSALAMQQTALEIERFNPQFLSDRAQIWFALHRYYDSLIAFNRVQAIEPAKIELWQGKFSVLEALNRPEEAQRVSRKINNGYTKLLQEQPQNEQIWLAQGDFYTTARMYGKAINSYERAIKLKPNLYEAWLAKGKALTQLGQTQEALTALNRALQIRPQSYMALQAIGSVYQNQNEWNQAISSYDRAIELNSNYAPLWRDRGLAYYQQQKYALAIESLSKASSLTSYDVTTWQGLANAWNNIGQEQKALSALDRAIEIEPLNINLWNQKGSIYINNGQYDEACSTYRQSRLVADANSPVIINSMMKLGCRMN